MQINLPELTHRPPKNSWHFQSETAINWLTVHCQQGYFAFPSIFLPLGKPNHTSIAMSSKATNLHRYQKDKMVHILTGWCCWQFWCEILCWNQQNLLVSKSLDSREYLPISNKSIRHSQMFVSALNIIEGLAIVSITDQQISGNFDLQIKHCQRHNGPRV